MFKISAVVPGYNAEQFIAITLESLAKQTYPLEEIIVIDDKSTDNTVKIAEKFGESVNIPVKVIHHATNQGVAAARNRGIAAASGDWILFMDADDIAVEGLLQTEVEYLQEQKKNADNWVVVYPAYSQIGANGQSISGIMRGIEMSSRNAFGCELVRNQLITPSGVLVNKAAMEAVGNFKVGLKHQVEDWELWLKLAKNGGGFAYVDVPLVKVRRHTANATKSMSKALDAEREIFSFYELMDIRRAIFSRDNSPIYNLTDYVQVLFKNDEWELGYEELNAIKDSAHASVLFLQGLYYLKRNLLSEARKCLERTVQINPNDGAALNNLGVIHGVLGNYAEAESYLQEALERFPGYMDAKNNIEIVGKRVNQPLAEYYITWRELRPILLSYAE